MDRHGFFLHLNLGLHGHVRDRHLRDWDVVDSQRIDGHSVVQNMVQRDSLLVQSDVTNGDDLWLKPHFRLLHHLRLRVLDRLLKNNRLRVLEVDWLRLLYVHLLNLLIRGGVEDQSLWLQLDRLWLRLVLLRGEDLLRKYRLLHRNLLNQSRNRNNLWDLLDLVNHVLRQGKHDWLHLLSLKKIKLYVSFSA